MPFQKGHPQYGHMRKGQKTKNTLEREEKERLYHEATTKNWLEIVDNESEEAKKDKLVRGRVIERELGKTPETIKHEGLPEGVVVLPAKKSSG